MSVACGLSTPCHENCSKGPVANINGSMVEKCYLEKIERELEMIPVASERNI